MIYAILGQTNAGKTTILNELKEAGVSSIITYTTRPIRKGEVNGVDYHFINEEQYEELSKLDMLAAKFTAENGWKYGINLESFNWLEDHFVVIEPDGLEDLIERIGKKNVTSIYIDIPNYLRFARGILRGDNIHELKRRLKSDEIDFKGMKEKADYTLDSLILYENLEDILKITQSKGDLKMKKHVQILESEYEELIQAQRKLDALEAYGVDNWNGYGEAMSYLEEEEE